MENILVIVQARTESKRLPRKVLKPLGSYDTVLEFLLDRLKQARLPHQIIVATTQRESDDVIARICSGLDISCFRGSETDVLSRYYKAATQFQASTVVRITADCPLVDPKMLDKMIDTFQTSNFLYMSNQNPPCYPDGFDIDIFTYELLKATYFSAKSKYDREHVTPFMKELAKEASAGFPIDVDYTRLRVTLDEPEDYEVLCHIVNEFGARLDFTWLEIVTLLENQPWIAKINNHFAHQSPSRPVTNGQKLYTRAKKLIPGGNSLLSKRPEMFLPEQWPNYYSRAKGIRIWDLDDNEFVDMSIMGIGTNILGYAHPAVDSRVINAVKSSNMSTFNAPEEVYLAERLLELHPWFGKARFARTGAEANALALRIARAAASRSKVAVCGYHGWHDWYLALNISSRDSLSSHLLSGLSTRGIPESLGQEVTSFTYNDFEEMRLVLSNPDLGVVFMEVMRSRPPATGFLEEIRQLCSERGIVLIFDECTSGFRHTFGGLHKTFAVRPDMAVFGKALGNGYAITAVLGTNDVMDVGNETFMSSTFWTERIGFVAALATIDEMEKSQSWEVIGALGNQMFETWKNVFHNNSFKVTTTGIPGLAAYYLPEFAGTELKTFITQEMLLRHQILASNIFYPSTVHTTSDISFYGEKLNEVLHDARRLVDQNQLLDSIRGPLSHTTFGRLN